MPVIEIITEVRAPVERVFDLARSIELHAISTAHTGARAVGGVVAGLPDSGQETTWRARHFGIRQNLTVRITQYHRPAHFRDSMVRGAFRRFDHDHFFTARGECTVMRDVFDYESPLGWLGRIADKLILERHMRHLVICCARTIKETAESERWRQFLPSEGGPVQAITRAPH
jgi:ligand-binding SRPBCC domain-containing protein